MIMLEHYFARVPKELVRMIANHLSDFDKIALKYGYPDLFIEHEYVCISLIANTAFFNYNYFYREINVRKNFAYSGENIATILKFHPNPNIVRKLEFSFCYWIQSKELCDFVKQCTNLKELSVAHSTLSNCDLSEIILEIKTISKLSFSIETPESFWLENEKKISSSKVRSDSLVNRFLNSHFGKCQESFARLESLEIYMGQYPTILGTLLRYNIYGYFTIEAFF